MRLLPFFATLSLALPAVALAAFDDFFVAKTMRVDYFHTGNRGEEIIALARVVSDGPWAGSRTTLIDTTNLGKYYFEVIDRATNQAIYSRGFASVYGEWETTDEAKERPGTFSESLRFPWPKKPVQIVLKKRDRENAFQQIWSAVVDPDSRFVNKADIKSVGKLLTIFENGPASEKVDLLVIGDGYTDAELPKFQRDLNRLLGRLFDTEPFKSRKRDFNVRALQLPSPQSGVHRPRTGDDRRSAIGTQYNIFDSERYVLTLDNRALRDAASAAPYDFLEILVNEKQYGGGGIFMDQATAAVDTGFAEYVFVHEFGHHFAGLGDEYYT
ncbi:MAG: M64 family metallopeptidase, partial [Gemmatimonadaceae bacterium]